MSVHAEILSDAQARVLHALAPVVVERGFYLVGGTAIALHFGHRRSVDLDWFTGECLADPMRLAQALRDEGLAFSTEQVATGTLHGEIDGVRISLLEYRYPLLQPLVPWPDVSGCRLAALDDLACMKLSAIAQRGAKKDFIDLYVLLTEHAPLERLLGHYRKKYATEDIAHLLYALTYFAEADRQRTPELLWDLDWPTVKHTVQREVKEVAG